MHAQQADQGRTCAGVCGAWYEECAEGWFDLFKGIQGRQRRKEHRDFKGRADHSRCMKRNFLEGVLNKRTENVYGHGA